MIDITQNPAIIAVCEIKKARLIGGAWQILGEYRHRGRKRHSLKIEAQAELIIGTPTPGSLIIVAGRLAPAGSRYQTHLRADYAKVMPNVASGVSDELDAAIAQVIQRFDSIKRRVERLAERERLDAAWRRLEAAVCNLT